jgi:IS30 family transposase
MPGSSGAAFPRGNAATQLAQRSGHVSHETIYTAIYAQPRGELRPQLIACLRHGHSTRMSRKRGTDRRGQIPDTVSIHVRPPEVDDRVMPGHWEGDFIVRPASRMFLCFTGAV